jgi:hypothetical protein
MDWVVREMMARYGIEVEPAALNYNSHNYDELLTVNGSPPVRLQVLEDEIRMFWYYPSDRPDPLNPKQVVNLSNPHAGEIVRDTIMKVQAKV